MPLFFQASRVRSVRNRDNLSEGLGCGHVGTFNASAVRGKGVNIVTNYIEICEVFVGVETPTYNFSVIFVGGVNDVTVYINIWEVIFVGLVNPTYCPEIQSRLGFPPQQKLTVVVFARFRMTCLVKQCREVGWVERLSFHPSTANSRREKCRLVVSTPTNMPNPTGFYSPPPQGGRGKRHAAEKSHTPAPKNPTPHPTKNKCRHYT